MPLMFLTDTQWHLVKDLLPPPPSSRGGFREVPVDLYRGEVPVDLYRGEVPVDLYRGEVPVISTGAKHPGGFAGQPPLVPDLAPGVSAVPAPPGAGVGRGAGARPRGRPSPDPRPILDLVLHKLATGIPWRELSVTKPSWQTCFHAFQRWHADGTLARVLHALRLDLLERGSFDFLQAVTQGQVLFIERSGRILICFPTAASLTWQLSTSRLFYRHCFEIAASKDYGSPPGPLMQILGDYT